MRTVGLVSSFREGPLLAEAIGSLVDFADFVLVFEGPVGDTPDEGPESLIPRLPNVTVRRGRWESDGAKRSDLVGMAQALHARYCDRWRGEAAGRSLVGASPSLWGLWLDGDELLLHGAYLKAYLRRIDAEPADGRGAGFKFPIRIVELDGSVALCHGKVIRVDLVRSYERSTTDVFFVDSPVMRVLGNEPNWMPARLDEHGEIAEPMWHITPIQRPPLQGEPHLLHRSALRPPGRARLRLHDAEADAWDAMKQRAGLGNV